MPAFKAPKKNLIEAVEHWFSGDQGEKDLEAAANAFNIVPEEAVAQKRNFEVWDENWEAVQMFLRLQTQWRVSINGPVGLDYGAAQWLFRLYAVKVKDQRSLLEDLQVMEATALAKFNAGGK